MTQVMYFGTTGAAGLMRWVPAPATGMVKSMNFWNNSLMFENGGAAVYRSKAYHVAYEMDFPVGMNRGLEVFTDYATGLYGTSPIYFVDPMIMDQNVMPPHWSAPMLCLDSGWPHIGNYVSSAATAANTVNQPKTSVTYNITDAVGAVPSSPAQSVVIPIPPGHQLYFGWSGSATGTGVLTARAHRRDGAADNVLNSTARTVTGTTRYDTGNIVNGNTHDYVTIYFSRTTAVASTVTVASISAAFTTATTTSGFGYPTDVFQPSSPLFPTLPSVNTQFVMGRGNTGCAFDGDVIPESYVLKDPSSPSGSRTFVGMSATLREVGCWL